MKYYAAQQRPVEQLANGDQVRIGGTAFTVIMITPLGTGQARADLRGPGALTATIEGCARDTVEFVRPPLSREEALARHLHAGRRPAWDEVNEATRVEYRKMAVRALAWEGR